MSGFGHRIQSVTPNAATKTLALVWDDGSTTTKALAALIGTKRVFRPLADPALFVQVQIINEGRAIAWPGDADMCADALWFDAHPEDNHLIARHGTAAE